MKDIIFSLEKLPEDVRDFSHNLLFGTPPIISLPKFDFDVSPNAPYIYDQSDLDFCTGESGSAESTVEFRSENDPSDPLYQFAKIKQIRGEYKGQGANLRDAAKSLTKYGSIPLSLSPYTHNTEQLSDRSRDYLANWANWPISLDSIASNRRLGSYFVPDGPNDAFDNIRAALWQNASTWAGSGVIFGLRWKPEWTYAGAGIIPSTLSQTIGGGHAMYIRGQKMLDSVPHLVFQQSWGKLYGDRGLYYFPRSVINAEFAGGHGAFVFKKIPATHVQNYISCIQTSK